jgi:hypothetical protein
MDEDFELPVHYNGKELHFPAKLTPFGHSYRIGIEVNGIVISFDKDEERNWRASVQNNHLSERNSVVPELLQAIAHSLDEV